MRPRHLTEEALLGLAGDRLPDDAKRAAEEHLAQCAECRQEYADFRFAHSVVERMAEIGYQEALGVQAPKQPKPAKRPRREFAFPWGPVIAISLGCVCVMVFLFGPQMVPTASAAELLSDAMQYENRAGGSPFRVQVSGQTCAGGHLSEKLVSLENSDSCSRALQKIQNTPWGHGNPLSAKTYATWRNSLRRRHDRVEKRDAAWEIETATDESVVRTASLELRASDYHATKLTLGFADHEEVSIFEDTTQMPIILAPADSQLVAKSNAPKLPHADSLADLMEVQAWTILHQLNADSGWEAIVVRDGSKVQVRAVVRDDARKEDFVKGFAANPGVELDIRSFANPGDVRDLFPGRASLEENAPALATKWLKQQFADPDQRADFSNNVLLSSQKILGRAFILDRLTQRQRALAHCACAKDFAALITTEMYALGQQEAGLSTSLEPLVGSPIGASNTLTLAQAIELDASLHELLWRSSASADGTFDTNIQKIRELLSRD